MTYIRDFTVSWIISSIESLVEIWIVKKKLLYIPLCKPGVRQQNSWWTNWSFNTQEKYPWRESYVVYCLEMIGICIVAVYPYELSKASVHQLKKDTLVVNWQAIFMLLLIARFALVVVWCPIAWVSRSFKLVVTNLNHWFLIYHFTIEHVIQNISLISEEKK